MAAALGMISCAYPAWAPWRPSGPGGGPPPRETIIRCATGEPVGFEALVEELGRARVVYVGETHSDPAHHEIQLRILRALHRTRPDLCLGMEMFDRTYQPVLDLWSSGRLEEAEFLKRSHWEANWRFDYALYRGILDFVAENRIRLIGLNYPFHIAPRIRIGGIDSLLPADRKHLADRIDLSEPAHREAALQAFQLHDFKGRVDFENFYAALCAWDDTMAETIARRGGGFPLIVVLAGTGHIAHRYGIPQRAFSRNPEDYRTVVPAAGEAPLDPGLADFLWVAPGGGGRAPYIENSR